MPYKNPEDQKRAARAHYEANKVTYKARAAAHRKKVRAEARDLIKAAKGKPCTDCGVQYPPYVMQFDHTGDKAFTIGARSDVSVERIVAEIEKCDVVCANCHAERTHERGQYGPRPASAAPSEDDLLF